MTQKVSTKIILIGIIIVLLGAVDYFVFKEKQAVTNLPFPPALIESDNVIDSFIKNAGFPKTQKVKISINIPEQNLKIFRISYGEPQDCPSGCFYSNATGIKYRDKIGWISINDYDHIDISNLVMYNFDASDAYIYTDDFLSALKTKDFWVYQNALLPKLIEDEGVPQQIKEKFKILR